VLTTTTTTVNCGEGDAKKEEHDENNTIKSQNNMISTPNDDISFITC